MYNVPSSKFNFRVYNGVRFGDYISAEELSKFDIVLTTYDVLRSEV